MASSSSFSCSTAGKRHEVFISFRGSDVREGFLSHLQAALKRNEVDAFVDEELERGEEIASSLLKIIEDSYISIVIFSENYAFSPWCLDELVKILECKKTLGQAVIPIFYRVDPTHVQELSGRFGDAIVKHGQDFKDSLYKVESWSQALKETAGMSGLVSQNIKPDSKLIKEIVRHILEKLNQLYSSSSDCYNDELVGIDSRVGYVASLLSLESPEVRAIGIWGMGGIGKSTIVNIVFDRIKDQFASPCFVANVREKLEKGMPNCLKNEILDTILGKRISNAGSSIMSSSSVRRRLTRKKVLIVLDDASDLEQIELLIGKPDIYAPGSRIIITSRDKQLLRNLNAEIYEVEALNSSEALKLLCLRAFKQCIPKQGYKALLEMAVNYAQGNPLALNVLGSNLYCRSLEEWEDELEKLKNTSHDKIGKILRISYDGLSEIEKEIFLYIACLFNREDRNYVVSILDMAGSRIGISRLRDKSLVSISENKLHMHDLLQQMGKDIACEENQLGKRRILWNPKDIYYLLTKNQGTEAIKGISLDTSKIRDISLSPKAFEGMYNLRYLIIYGTDIKLYLPEGLEFLPDELRYLCWYPFPWKSLPINFCAEKLVHLCMPNSHMEELWNGVQNLANLKWVDLSYSKKLTKIPDLSRALNVEVLNLSVCTSLAEIPSSIKYLSKLSDLHLEGCSSLCHLPSCLPLISLKLLGLSGCSKLTAFPDIPCSKLQFQLTDLYLDECSRLESLPDSICYLLHLEKLNISGCASLCELPQNLGNLKFLQRLIAYGSGLSQLPDSVCDLKKLQCLDVRDCVNLRGLPQNLGNLDSLEELIAYGSGIRKELSMESELILPPMMTGDFCNLWNVNLNYCGISEFPGSLCSAAALKILYIRGNNFESIPESFKQLPVLEELDLRDCKKLKYLPDFPMSLLLLYASNCESLETVFGQWNNIQFRDFHNCIRLDQTECDKMTDHVLNVENIEEMDELWLCIPGTEVPQNIMYQNKSGSSLSFSFELQEQTDLLQFYLCAVLDPPICESSDGQVSIKYDAHLIDESGLCIDSKESKFGYYGVVVQSKHVFLELDWLFNLSNLNSVKGRTYKVVFEFYAIEIVLYEFKGHNVYDAIIKCGVQPVFEHKFICWNMENGQRKREREGDGEGSDKDSILNEKDKKKRHQ